MHVLHLTNALASCLSAAARGCSGDVTSVCSSEEDRAQRNVLLRKKTTHKEKKIKKNPKTSTLKSQARLPASRHGHGAESRPQEDEVQPSVAVQ